MRDRQFSHVYNSKNIDEIRGEHFDDVICAGVSAVKWLANKEPDADLSAITKLIDCLESVSASRFTLISTIDVYENPVGVNELDEPINNQPYGKHRYLLEKWVREKFESAVIVRLPGLFGHGLKKNIIYDFLNKNMTQNIVPNAEFQWYPMRRLNSDLELISGSNVKLINICSEPLVSGDIASRFFPEAIMGSPQKLPPRYDVRSIHANLTKGNENYHILAEEVYAELQKFIETINE
ncbi:hypothetical protein BJF95_04680 [Rhizobium oryziradicis]|uniref:NAD-dependent epimerase/dehydratase domain-containing protein n=2 Tax=Rhizobium oryziradicis TaxID=1867956 RepID=A0A1Q8ZS24_9HYPH|nr:hypothetical protein BJF95_04680 [Rhizobium oryziradicis]